MMDRNNEGLLNDQEPSPDTTFLQVWTLPPSESVLNRAFSC